jgi:hypothetical protein
MAHPVWLQLMRRPESLHTRFAQAGFAGHGAHAGPPVRRPGARQTQGPYYSPGRKPRFASPPRGVFEPLQAPGGKSLPPTISYRAKRYAISSLGYYPIRVWEV